MRARLLFVPIFAAFEAVPFAEANAAWADVQSFDTPGAASRRDEPAGSVEDAARAGSGRLDELRWESCVVVCDSHAQAAGIELALADPRVKGICISHAAARYSTGGDRAAINPGVHAAAGQLLDTDLRSFARALTQLTQGAIDEEWADRFVEEVPRETVREGIGQLVGQELASRLGGWDGQALLGLHEGCLMWTREGFEDAVAAVPGAATVECGEVPLNDQRFRDAARALCERVAG
jgi:hypothetical protein